jgi:cytoskeletal protein CcmA (bactofilin family)
MYINNHTTMRKYLIALVAVLFLFGTQSASALLLDSGDIVNPKEKVQGDAYLAGQTVQIDSPIEGDAVIAAGKVDIDATISEDLIIAGDSVAVNKDIGDDIRIAASNVTIKGNVKGDVIVFAQTLIIDKNATISGDIIAFVSQLKLDGTVKGNIRVASENTTITGEVQGDSNIRTGDFTLDGNLGGKTTFTASETVDISEASLFGGNVIYGFTKELDLKPNLAEGTKATFDAELLKEKVNKKDMGPKVFSGFLVWEILSAALVIGLIFNFNKKFIQKAVKRVSNWEEGFRAFIYGALLFFIPIAIIILLIITIIGIPLALFTLFAYISLIVFSQAIASIVTAQWLHKKYQFGKSDWQIYFIALGIYVVLSLLAWLPILGFIIGLGVVYTSLGALVLEYRNK